MAILHINQWQNVWVRGCGSWGNRSVLRPEIPRIGQVMGENGYETCLIGKYHLGGNNQFGGFKHRSYGDLTGMCGHQHEPDDSPYSKSIECGVNAIMPNHFHCIMGIVGADLCVCPDINQCHVVQGEHTEIEADTQVCPYRK